MAMVAVIMMITMKKKMMMMIVCDALLGGPAEQDSGELGERERADESQLPSV